MSVSDHYDRSLPRDPCNMVGKHVAREIHSRTGLKGDFTTSMCGSTAFRIANEVWSLFVPVTTAHLIFAANWHPGRDYD